jgi:flavin reductase (DIM6/NTAB) family NADH-FMN oxidoreductase RutF
VTVSSDEFRSALSRFASGVTVVTTLMDSGEPHGITVSAFCSVSLEPPLVLVCIDRRASVHDQLGKGRHFAVNVLAEHQEDHSRRFASKHPDRFKDTHYTSGITGVPVLEDALANIECRVVEAHPAGDHTIVVGEVEAIDVREGKPLAYFRGGYVRLS